VPPDVQWYWMDTARNSMGEFVWTGIDYLGGPYWCDKLRKNPRFSDPAKQVAALEEVKKFGMTRSALHTCDTGFFDQALFKKDAFWLFKSRWLPEVPSAHILPHWNWAGREGQVTPVYVFTSGDEGELFLNGVSQGRVKKQPGVWNRAYRLRWDNVRYQPGTLEVVVYKEGREWARDKVTTAGEPAALTAEVLGGNLAANGEDVAYVMVKIVDKDGNFVPTAANEVTFAVEGDGEIVATDNGFEGDMSDFRSPKHVAFNGCVQATVRAKVKGVGQERGQGTFKVQASAKGLRSTMVDVHFR